MKVGDTCFIDNERRSSQKFLKSTITGETPKYWKILGFMVEKSTLKIQGTGKYYEPSRYMYEYSDALNESWTNDRYNETVNKAIRVLYQTGNPLHFLGKERCAQLIGMANDIIESKGTK